MPPKRGCPGCGHDYTRLLDIYEAGFEVCGNVKCGLPVALWPRWRAAMEMSERVRVDVTAPDAWRRLARRVRGGKR
jgi:hypothetical protein